MPPLIDKFFSGCLYRACATSFYSSSDVATATTTKKALEGHCIYDGGDCKLRLSYSRHTDINVKV